MNKVIAIGEALIDFIPVDIGCELKEVTGFTKSPGGAPANVAACVRALGGKSQMITKLGKDAFGDFLVETIAQAGIDVSSILRTEEANTALAFVSLQANGERDFSFYRNPSADMLLQDSEIQEEWFNSGDILHFCSVDLVDAPVRGAHDRALKIAKEKGLLICFDPNVRLPLWKNHEAYQQVIRKYIPYANILKVSDEELAFITGIEDETEALEWLKGQVDVLIYTKGKEGAYMIAQEVQAYDRGFPTNAVDTTGAGDSFIGAILYQILQYGLPKEESLAKQMLIFANAVASLVVERKGAIAIMPKQDEVQIKIATRKV